MSLIRTLVASRRPRHLRPLAAALLLASAGSALAHVHYIDLTNPAISPGGVNGSSFSSSGWFEGTRTVLGDSHDLAGGDFFSFRLDQAARVSITFKDASPTISLGRLNPAFSLYRGLLPDEGHDDANFDPVNPKQLVFAPPPPHAVKLASPVDNGTTVDAHGRVSPFRDTAHVEYAGQFNALGSWSMAHASGEWSVIEYVTHVAPAGGNVVTLSNHLLAAGDYTIAAAGGWDPSILALTNIPGEVSLTITPVPEPASVAMLLAGLVVVGTGVRTRRACRFA